MSSLHAQCPACDKTIDAAHATVAKIVGARVLTYCSRQCADATPKTGAAKTSAAKTSAAKTSAAKTSAAKTSAAKTSAAKTSAAKTSAAKTSAAKTSAAKTSAPEIAPAAGAAETADAARAPVSAAVSSDVSVASNDSDSVPVVRTSLATARRTANRRIIAVASLFLVGGMLLTIIKAVSPSSPSQVEASSERPHMEAPVAVPAPAAADSAPSAPTAEQLRGKAIFELRAMLASPSPRVRRLSARALARTGDKEALALLHKELASSKDQLSQVRMAYAIARGGDDAGKVALVKLLKGTRRDVRLDAARSLVRLSDNRGAPQLKDMMSYRQFKLGAAGLLARLGNEKAKKLLRGIASGGRHREERQRAAVALGRAGVASVEPVLEKILAKGPHVGAAHALAVLGNKAAVPQLIAQLDLAAIRVEAAVSLRRLGETVDLAPLAAGLATGREVARASAAEAILILTGTATEAGFQ